MKHMIVTTNDEASKVAMSSYKGTKMIHEDEDFVFWYCKDVPQGHLNKITGQTTQEVTLVGLLLLNKPQ